MNKYILSILGAAAFLLGTQHADAKVEEVQPKYFENHTQLARLVAEDFFSVVSYPVSMANHPFVPKTPEEWRQARERKVTAASLEIKADLDRIVHGENPYESWIILPSPTNGINVSESYNNQGHFVGGFRLGPPKMLHHYTITKT